MYHMGLYNLMACWTAPHEWSSMCDDFVIIRSILRVRLYLIYIYIRLIPYNTSHLSHKASRVLFQINAKTVPPSEAFPYLRQTITYNNSDWAEVYPNLQKARRWWGMISTVLERTGEKVRSRGEMYKAVTQLVLLYVSEIWVVTGEMLKALPAFHRRMARRTTGMTTKRGAGGEWKYQAVEEAMDSSGLHPIGLYIKRRQKTIAKRVAWRPLYALWTEAERILRTSRMVRWWNQDAVNDSEE